MEASFGAMATKALHKRLIEKMKKAQKKKEEEAQKKKEEEAKK